MSRKYRVGDNRHAHFKTFTVVNWIDFFIRNEYRDIFVKSIKYCQDHKGLEVYSYCIMPSHVHMIVGTDGQNKLEAVIRDLKRYTSICFHDVLTDEKTNYESRKDWMLWSDEIFYQKMDYIHLNPVVSGFVSQPEDWLYSSASNHAGLSCFIHLVDD